MARLSTAGLDALAATTFESAGDPKISAEDIRNYFAIINKNRQVAVGYGFLLGSNPLNNFEMPVTTETYEPIKFLQNPDWGGEVNVGAGLPSAPFDGVAEIGVDAPNNRVTISRKSNVIVDCGMHFESIGSNGNNRQVVVDLYRYNAATNDTTMFGYDIYVNSQSQNRTDSAVFPTTKIAVEAGDSVGLMIKLSPNEGNATLKFLKCSLLVELQDVLD